MTSKLLLVSCALLFSLSVLTLYGDEISVASGDDLAEPVAPLSPKQPRTEAEEDQILASSWFLKGRLAHQRDDLNGALKSYQRAWRYDGESASVLKEIVPLAFELKQNAAAARYAIIMAEKSPRDAILLKRLAQFLIDEGNYARALGLYEKALELQKGDKRDAAYVLSQMEIGRLYFLEKKHEQAAAAFAVVRDALNEPEKFGLNEKIRKALLGEGGMTYSIFAESFLSAGRLEEAAEMFEKAHEDEAEKPVLAFQLARVELKNDRPDSALTQLDEYFAAKDSAAGEEPYELLEEVYGKLHPKDKAREQLEQRLTELYTDDAANVALTYFLARKQKEWGNFDEAVRLYESAVGITPTADAFDALIEIYAAQENAEKLLDVLGKAADQTRSLDIVDKSLKKVVDDESLVDQLIKLAAQRREKAGDHPNVGEALAVAGLAVKAKKFAAAEENFEVAVKHDEELRAATLESWGLAMFLAKEYERSAKVFQRAIDDKVAERFNGDFYYYLAAALEFAGKTDEALVAAKKASEIRNGAPRYAARAAWVLYHAERYEEAKKAYEELIAKHDDDHSTSDVRDVMRESRMILSTIGVHQEDMPAAEQRLEEVLDEFPEDIGAMNDLGYLWSDQGKHLLRSLAMVKKAVAGEPDNAAYLDSLGWAYYRVGKYDDAIAQLKKAVELGESPDGVMLDHLGDAYWAAGKKQAALDTWRQAAKVLEDEKDAKHLEKTRAKIKSHE